MYTIQKTAEIKGKIITLYYTQKNEWGTEWTEDPQLARIFNTEQEAEAIANIGKPIIRPKQ